MAVWMAVNLSAPSMPAKQLMGPKESGASLKLAKPHSKQTFPFGCIPRAKPEYVGSGGMSGREVVFHARTLDIRTLQTFGIPYQEEHNPDVSSQELTL